MSKMHTQDREALITLGFVFSIMFATMFVIFAIMFILPIEEPFPSFSLVWMLVSLAGSTMGIPYFKN